MSRSARKAAPVAEVERQVVCCVGESGCRGRSISESDPAIQTARKHNTTKLERGCPGSREMRNRKDQGYSDDRKGSRSRRGQAPGEQKSGREHIAPEDHFFQNRPEYNGQHRPVPPALGSE